jgi:hypothetical protein
MDSLENARKHLRALLAEIEQIAESQFPYPDCRDAAKELHRHLSELLVGLEIAEGEEVKVPAYESARRAVLKYLPLLGFLRNSLEVRIPFEIYGPLLRIAARILEEDDVDFKHRRSRLVLSYAWDYSPFIDTRFDCLPHFMLIGLPAHESDNPLLVPLSGHEIGHMVWNEKIDKKSYWSHLSNEIDKAVNSQDLSDSFNQIVTIIAETEDLTSEQATERLTDDAIRVAYYQAMETFCDFMGLRIFGESYLHSFQYLLGGEFQLERALGYPNLPNRVANLTIAAANYGIPVPPEYQQGFADSGEPDMSSSNRLLFIRLPDKALTDVLVQRLANEASTLFLAAGIEASSEAGKKYVVDSFKRLVPATGCRSLADILNGAWWIANGYDILEEIHQENGDREKILRELVLKNIEVYEYEQIIGG